MKKYDIDLFDYSNPQCRDCDNECDACHEDPDNCPCAQSCEIDYDED